MKLYEIAESYAALMSDIEAGEIPEEAIADTLEAIGGEFNEKADNVACIIKSFQADAKALKEEEEALATRRKSAASSAEYLTGYLSAAMQRLGVSKVETSRNLLSFRKSVALEIGDEEAFKALHPGLCEKVVTTKIPKKAITDLIKAGIPVDGALLVERQNLQIK